MYPEDSEQKKAKLRAQYADLSSGPGVKPLAIEGAPSGPLPQFGAMRARVQQRAQAEGQSQANAMKRRLAATGTLNSGGGIRAVQQVQDSAARRTEDAIQGVDAQEAEQRTAMDEAAKGRNFQRETFNANQAFQEKSFRADNAVKFAGLESQIDAMDLQRLQLKLQQEESSFNQRLARWQAGKTGGLFGGGGFLGTGIGTKKADF